MNEFSKIEQGEILNGKYKIISLIAEGGMGKTYKGIELSSGKEVALKILHFSRLDDWKILELFEREVVLLKNIDHPNIPDYVDNFEIDKSGDRLYVLVQEYVEGDNLQVIAESGKRFSVELVMKIFKELLKILTYIHTLQPPVIHRDINPKNIVIGKEGKIYLVDFGAAGQVAKSTFAASGTFVGTIGYMAQEQLYGKTLPATDLYSLGVTIAFLLTGREPSDFALIDMKLDYKPYAEAPEFLTDAIDAIIEPDLNKRTSSAKEVLRILDKKVLRRPDVISVSYGNKNQKISSSSKKVLKTIIAFSVVSLIISGIISFIAVGSRNIGKRPAAAATQQASRAYASSGPLDTPRRVEAALNKFTCLIFSKSGKYAAGAGDDDVIRIWDAKSGNLLKKLEGHRRDISIMKFSPDENTLISIGQDKLVIIWDFKSGKVLKYFKVNRVYGDTAIISHDASYVVTTDYLRKIEIINIKTGKIEFSVKSPYYISGKLAISTDLRFIAFSSSGGEVILFDKILSEFNVLKSRMSYVKLLFLTNSTLTVIGSEKRNSVIETIGTIKKETVNAFSFGSFYFNSTSVNDEGDIAVFTNYSGFSVVDIKTGQIVSKIRTGFFTVNGIAAITPDKKSILFFGKEKALNLMQIKSGKNILTFDFE